ncbi:VOC family protein [Nocardiopsis protaetiae]|uniref:VOC family protein n=1 Tax=Nocardiopsis protaetiae TaxID=3382270 RepID=UPI00387B4FD2
MDSIATFSLVALDCPDPVSLAEFYAAITGWRIGPWEDDTWIQLVSGTGATLAFQKAPGHVPPEWPGDERPQQLHLDFDVPDLDTGEQRVLAIGARKAGFQPAPDSFRVYLDPAGHPFCLVRAD